MTGAIVTVAGAIALFEALRILLSAGDLLRLQTMSRLALALGIVSLALDAGLWIAAAIAFSACVLHPDLRPRPMLPMLLLMLSPAVAIWAAVAVAIGFDVRLSAFDIGDAAQWRVWLGLSCLAAAHSAFGFGWRIRLVGLTAATAVLSPFAWAWVPLAGSSSGGAMLALTGAFYLAFRPQDVWALRRVAFAAAGAGVPLFVFAAHAGPWTQAEGEQLLIVRAPLSSNSAKRDAYSVQTYSESGVADGVTFVATGFQEVSPSGSQTGGSAGLRVRFWSDEEWIVSGEASAGVEPFSLRSETDIWERHAQGELKALAGWGGDVAGSPAYANAELGWRFRPEAFGDVAVFAISGGVDLSPELQMNAHASFEAGVHGDHRTFGQASLVWRIDETVSLEAGVQAVAGDEGYASANAFAGLWLRF